MSKTRFFLVVLALAGLSIEANAQQEPWDCGDNVKATLDGGTLRIYGTGDMWNSSASMSPWSGSHYLIKKIVIGYGVTSIGNSAFSSITGYPNLNSVTIPSSVKSIGMLAFGGCANLRSINIPNSVKSIGDGAFQGCSGVTSINIPNSVTSIGNSAFSYCSALKSINIPNSVISIGNGAFSGCKSLISIDIPKSVKIIGSYAFESCSSLKSVIIPNNVTSIGYEAFQGCSSLSSVIIPNSVTWIGERAFSGCKSLIYINIPDGITSIGHYTFSSCSSLRFIAIPDSVTSIGSDVFYGCSSLTSLTIGKSVTSIGYEAFQNCNSLKSITCKAKSPPIVGSRAFSYVPKNIPVYVPCDSVDAYRKAPEWYAFTNYQCDKDLEITLHWDYNGYVSTDSPKGVAADGVARLLVRIKDMAYPIKNVSVKLSASLQYNQMSMLGKLCQATTFNTYEADKAKDIFVNNVSPDTNTVWLWYVSPDDFCNEYNTDLENEALRYVNMDVEVLYVDSSTIQRTVPIEVVRPPLMLAHGLDSDPSCWDKFHHDGSLFKSSPLYAYNQVNAITLYPNASYAANACVLLGLSGNNNANSSFRGTINSLREKGIAVNQVDYVCHSMGGCVLRKAIEGYAGYYSDENYKKGYVHKAITINTPHNGSPIADFVTTAGPVLSTTIWSSVVVSPAISAAIFIKFKNMLSPYGKASDAVKDLRMGEGGVKFGTTSVKNHIIAGDINLDIFSGNRIEIFDIIKSGQFTWAEIMRRSKNVVIKDIIGVSALEFLDLYFNQKGVTNFFGDGDGVVSLSSQLAQREGQHNLSNSNTKFEGLTANHLSIVDRSDVGNKVKDLLNKEAYMESFNYTISANNNPIPKSLDEIIDVDSLTKPVVLVFDNLHIEIVSPDSIIDLGIEDTLHLTFRIKDTNNLMFVDYLFQDNYGISVDKNELQTIDFIISPDFLDKQTIYVVANYDMGDTTICYIDTISVSVVTDEWLTDFTINPKVAYIYTTQYYYPQMQATYETFVSSVPCNSNRLTVSVSDTSIVGYDQNYYCFIGKDTGTTFAVIAYDSLQDTLYFNVMLLPKIEEDSTVGIKEIELQKPSNNKANIRVYPNPTTGQLTIEYGSSACFGYAQQPTLTAQERPLSEVEVEIYDVMGRKVGTYQFPSFGGAGVVSSGGGVVLDSQTTPSYGHPSKGGELAPSLSERAGGEVVIDISHLSSGMYFLKIGNNVVKFVKE